MTIAAASQDPTLPQNAALLDPKNWWKAYLLAWLPLGAAYLIILGVFVDVSGITLLSTWTANILYPSIISIGVVWYTLNEVVKKRLRLQITIHTFAAVAFSALWALTLFRLLQLFNGLLNDNWAPPIWPSPVIAWQLFQGLALYFIIVSGTYAYWALTQLHQRGVTTPADAPMTRIFGRSDVGLVPVAIAEIHAVQTDNGSTVLHTGRTKLESRMSISDLETLLPSDKFVRIHRTVLINLDEIHSVEAAGNGRQTVHLKNSTTFETSRAGAAALKSRFAIV